MGKISCRSTIRMFFVRSKIERGVPFNVTLPDNMVTRNEALKALDLMFEQAKDVPDMTLDEINAEIKEVRDARRAKK